MYHKLVSTSLRTFPRFSKDCHGVAVKPAPNALCSVLNSFSLIAWNHHQPTSSSSSSKKKKTGRQIDKETDNATSSKPSKKHFVKFSSHIKIINMMAAVKFKIKGNFKAFLALQFVWLHLGTTCSRNIPSTGVCKKVLSRLLVLNVLLQSAPLS